MSGALARRVAELRREEDETLTGEAFQGETVTGLDLSWCDIDGITVSETFSELKGLTVGAHQTVGLARLLGMKVEG